MHSAPHCSPGQGQGVRSDLIRGDIRSFFNHRLFWVLKWAKIVSISWYWLLTMDPSSIESKLITVTWNWTRVGFPESKMFWFVVAKCHCEDARIFASIYTSALTKMIWSSSKSLFDKIVRKSVDTETTWSLSFKVNLLGFSM